MTKKDIKRELRYLRDDLNEEINTLMEFIGGIIICLVVLICIGIPWLLWLTINK